MRIAGAGLLVSASLLLAPGVVRGDMSIELVRDVCIPEFSYHLQETKESSLLAEAIAHGFESFDDTARQKRLSLLEANGLYLPEVQRRTCNIPPVSPVAPVEGDSIGVLRIVCLPALRYLEVEVIQDSRLSGVISQKLHAASHQEREKYLQVLAEHNLYLADNLNYSCKMPETTYRMGTRDIVFSGGNQGQPDRFVGFDLWANDKPWLQGLRASPVVDGQPLITSFIISDGKRGWTPYREAILCLNENGGREPRCDDMRFRLADEEAMWGANSDDFLPVTQGVLVPTPSFNCAVAATALDKAICRDKKLSRIDAVMAKFYQHASERLDSKRSDALRMEQRQWLKSRTEKCAGGDSSCLKKLYEDRIYALWFRYENRVAFRVPNRYPEMGFFKGSRGMCGFTGLDPSDRYLVYAAGGYRGRSLNVQIDQSGYKATQFDVAVNSPDKPVVLILGAYEPSIWNVSWTKRTRILAVLATGYHRQAVAGLPDGTPILVSTGDNDGSCGGTYIDNRLDNRAGRVPDPSRTLSPLSKKVFGKPEDKVYFADKNGRIVVGEAIPVGEHLATSQDTLPENFPDKRAALAGEDGLRDAVAKGFIRPATMKDREEWIKRRAGITPKYPSQPWHDGGVPIVANHTYVILKPFKIPAGGGFLAVFYLADGVPFPDGELGHSPLYDFNTMACHGVVCNH